MNKTVITGVVALLLCGLAAPAPVSAGSVYVPIATDQVEAGVRYQTQVWITNEANQQKTFIATFIPSNSDGTQRNDPDGTSITVNPRSTIFLSSVVAAGQMGMLEIRGDGDIVVNAQMLASKDGQASLGAPIPVVSSQDVFPANSEAPLQRWIRSADLRSDIGIVNLGHQQASCSISVFRNNGNQIQGTAVITVPPLGHRQFDDALSLLGISEIAAVRSDTSCDQPFYAYLRTYDRISGEVLVNPPSRKLAASTLISPSDTQEPQGCDGGGSLCFQRPGVFFVPRVADDYRRETFGVPAGVYSRVHMRVEIVHGGWTPPTSGLHLAFWLAKSGRNRNLFGFSGFRGPGRNQVLFRHGIGTTAGAKAKIERNFQPLPGQTYIIDYDYNPGQGFVQLQIFDIAGNQLVNIIDAPNVNAISFGPNDTITADFSFRLGHNPNEPPSYGWQYRNLLVEIE